MTSLFTAAPGTQVRTVYERDPETKEILNSTSTVLPPPETKLKSNLQRCAEPGCETLTLGKKCGKHPGTTEAEKAIAKAAAEKTLADQAASERLAEIRIGEAKSAAWAKNADLIDAKREEISELRDGAEKINRRNEKPKFSEDRI